MFVSTAAGWAGVWSLASDASCPDNITGHHNLMSVENIYEQNLGMNQANFAPLTPLSFLERSASVYPERPSVIHGDTTYTWAETYARSCRLASALSKMGIGEGDTVSFMGANTPETFEAHFGVPMTGAVLNALNVRLDASHRIHSAARGDQGPVHGS